MHFVHHKEGGPFRAKEVVMRTSKIFGLVLGALMALTVAVPVTRASEENQLSRLTLSDSFHLPGRQVLAAGTYWFRILDNVGQAQNIVLIYNAERSDIVATIVTRPTYRTEPTNTTELDFASSSREVPTLLKWFYPGQQAGHAFIYSPRTERRLREENVRDILATPVPVAG